MRDGSVVAWLKHTHQDLSLFRQGLSILREVGPHGLGEMLRMAEFVERSIYEEGSFRTASDGSFSFRLLNPPLRMGAFHAAALALDTRPIDPAASFVEEDGSASPRPLSALSRTAPLNLRPGVPVRFLARAPALTRGSRHTVELTLRSVAIPPKVWVRFTDELR